MKRKNELKNKPVDQKTYLTDLLEKFTKLQAGSKSKMDKCQDLLQREGSKKWDEKKKKKMLDRHSQASLEYKQSFEIIDQIKDRLNQI